MARLVDEGWHVHVLIVVLSGYASTRRGDASTTSVREQELADALAVLGVTSRGVLYRGEDEHLRLDTVPQKDLIGAIEGVLAEERPSVVVMPCMGDHHQDHRAVSSACLTALRPAPEGRLPFVPLVLAYGQTGSQWGGAAYPFTPTAFVDITGVLDRKLEAMSRYTTQLCPPPHPRSLDGIRAWAASFGALAGCAYAEGFECLRYAV